MSREANIFTSTEIDRVEELDSLSGNANKVVSVKSDETGLEFTTNGAGDVSGPGSSTDNTLPRFDGTGGKTLQTSGITVDDSDNVTGINIDANGSGNSITNIDVADLANGTDGELITWDSAGAPTTVSAGTSGQVLTSNGAGAEPTFQDASGGGNGHIISGTIAGTQNTGVVLEIPVSKSITAGTFRISLGTVPTGADFICKLYKNGVEDASATIGTGASTTNGLYQATDTTFVSGSYAAGDVLKVEITQVGSSVAGSDFTFSLVE